MAEKASRAEISAITSDFTWSAEPKVPEAEASTSRTTVSSRSSTYFLTNGWPMREVTFQSMVRTSSPIWYSRTSENSIPRPLKTEW
jgi:hypothetical protein